MSHEDSVGINTGTITRRLRKLSVATSLEILVVDDDEIERALIGDRLCARAFDALEAQDGKEALALMRQHPQPVVLVDWQMPVMDGIEFTEQVRSLGMHDTFIIMLTARDAQLDYERGYAAGVDDYISKRVSDVELMARVHTAFAMHSLRVELQAAHRKLEQLRGKKG